jgi:O-antigen/teichoic acid export membrane protein
MLKRNILANFVGNIWVALMGVAFVPVYIKYLGVEAYGLIGLSAVIITTLTFLDLGLSPMLSREMARYRGGNQSADSICSLLRVVELYTWSIGLLGVVALWFIAPWLATSWIRSESLSPDTVTHALRILALVVVFRLVEGVYRGVLIGLQEQVRVNVLAAGAATLRAVGAIAVLAWWSPSLHAFIWWQGAVAAVSLGFFMACGHAALPHSKVSLDLGIRTLRASWPFARGMLVSSFLVLGLTQTDKVLLARLLTLSEYGQYSLALIASSCVAMAANPIGQALYPRLTELHARGTSEAFVREFHRGAQLVMVAAGSVGIVMIVFADRIMLLWTGDPELVESVSTPVRLLATGSLLNSCMLAVYICQLATGWTALANSVNTVSILLVVPALILVVPRAGMAGAAAIWAALNMGYVLTAAPLTFRRLMPGEMFSWYVHDTVIPLAAGFTVCLMLRAASPFDGTSATQQVILVLSSAIATLSAVLITAPMVRRGMIAMLHRWLYQSQSSG